MRRHGRHARFAPRIDSEAFHHIVRPEYLVSARLDPGFALRIDSEGLLDLAFARDGKIVLLPFVLMQAVMMLMRESSPYIWPIWMPPLRENVARDIEGLLEPWIKSLMLGRFANDEYFALFGTDTVARAQAERARAYGFLGAAETDGVLRAVSPYIYAQRFASDKRVSIVDRDGASGAAILARSSREIRADLLDDERAALARCWFGLDIFGGIAAGDRFDIAIGGRAAAGDASMRIVLDEAATANERRITVTGPIPPDYMVSFDPGDGGVMRELAVSAPNTPGRPSGIAPMQIVGGSSGRIGIVVRSDYLGNDDADSDAAAALAGRLREQGFVATIVPASHLRADEHDLLHVFGQRALVEVDASLQRRPARVPIVASPYADDARREAAWGASIIASTLLNAPDEALRNMYFDAIRERRLESEGAKRGDVGTDGPSMLARSAGAVAASDVEERRLHEEFGVTVSRIVAGVLAPELPPESTTEITGLDDFVLLHAPMEARCNQYPVARAAADLGYPLVLVGSVRDTNYYCQTMAALGDRGIWLGSDQLTPGELAGLYARCRVFVDASWSASGLYRLLRAGAAGAALVAPASGYARGVWPGLAQMVDPASAESIRDGLRNAWERSGELGPLTVARTMEIADPFKSLVGVLAVYQAAAQAVSLQS